MATHSSIPAWGIPWTEEPGRLQSMGSQKVRHDLITKQQKHICYPQFKKKNKNKKKKPLETLLLNHLVAKPGII